jgi:hypothetical protein
MGWQVYLEFPTAFAVVFSLRLAHAPRAGQNAARPRRLNESMTTRVADNTVPTHWNRPHWKPPSNLDPNSSVQASGFIFDLPKVSNVRACICLSQISRKTWSAFAFFT